MWKWNRNREMKTKNPQQSWMQVGIRRESIYSWPVPDPESLSRYDEISPWFANRLIIMAEKEQSHRHECTHNIIRIEEKISAKSINYSFIILFSALLLSGYLFYLDKDGAAIWTLVTTLVAGWTSFLYYNKKWPSDHQNEKSDDNSI